MNVQQAKAAIEAAGLEALEQRGFYSHFLRIRKPDLETVDTIDINDAGEVDADELSKILEHFQASISRTQTYTPDNEFDTGTPGPSRPMTGFPWPNKLQPD